MSQNECTPQQFKTVCEHEVAHAVMRWHLCGEGSHIVVSRSGEGKTSPADDASSCGLAEQILIYMAGWAWEDGEGHANIHGQWSFGEDFKDVHRIMEFCPVTTRTDFEKQAIEIRKKREELGEDAEIELSDELETVDQAIRRFHDKAQEILFGQYKALIPALALRLAKNKRLSVKEIEDVMRSWKTPERG